MLDYVDAKYPRYREGIDEAMRVDTDRFGEVASYALEWAERARGPRAIEQAVDAYAQFTTDVNLAQARYERTGEYENHSFEELLANHYSQESEMSTYLWGIYLTNFLWAHHMELWRSSTRSSSVVCRKDRGWSRSLLDTAAGCVGVASTRIDNVTRLRH